LDGSKWIHPTNQTHYQGIITAFKEETIRQKSFLMRMTIEFGVSLATFSAGDTI